jgi:predicted RNA-binding Zn ribbon-like protein
MIAVTATRGTWHRLRMCAAPDCRWVFYDTSRRGGARWCSMAVCGNRAKTRRYRNRQAQAAGLSEPR